MSMEVSKKIVRWAFLLFTGRIQPTYIGVIIHLLSTMNIPVALNWKMTFLLKKALIFWVCCP